MLNLLKKKVSRFSPGSLVAYILLPVLLSLLGFLGLGKNPLLSEDASLFAPENAYAQKDAPGSQGTDTGGGSASGGSAGEAL